MPRQLTGATVVSASGFSDVATAHASGTSQMHREHDEHGVQHRRTQPRSPRGPTTTVVMTRPPSACRRGGRAAIETIATTTMTRKNTNDIALA